MQENSMQENSLNDSGLTFRFDENTNQLFVDFVPCSKEARLSPRLIKKILEANELGHLLINEYVLFELIPRYKNTGESFSITVGEKKDATYNIHITEDRMRVVIALTPNFGGEPVTLEKIKNLLNLNGVVHGIIADDEIEEILMRQQTMSFVIAEGTKSIPGTDAKFKHFIPEKEELKPRINGKGIANYRELGDILTVQKGKVVMRRIPAVPGISGLTVTGHEITPYDGKNIPFSSTKTGVCIDPENEDQLIATITGTPVVLAHSVMVLPVFSVSSVDLKTGNIRFDGAVIVKGDVVHGMLVHALTDVHISGNVIDARIECGGNLIVKGSVTGDSKLQANGEINVECGVQGYKLSDKEKKGHNSVASLMSNGNVRVGFIENATVQAKGDIVVDQYSLHSHLSTNSNIIVGKTAQQKSAIIGGSVYGMKIYTSVLGAKTGIYTYIKAGLSQEMRERIIKLKGLLAVNEDDQEKVNQIIEHINNPKENKQWMLPKLKRTLSKLLTDAEKYKAELLKLSIDSKAYDDISINADLVVHPGVEIQMNGLLWSAAEKRSKSMFIIEEDQIVIR
jgi:uncharacterized protein (DUF342 family)